MSIMKVIGGWIEDTKWQIASVDVEFRQVHMVGQPMQLTAAMEETSIRIVLITEGMVHNVPNIPRTAHMPDAFGGGDTFVLTELTTEFEADTITGFDLESRHPVMVSNPEGITKCYIKGKVVV